MSIDCIFCKIIANNAEASIIHQDEFVTVFMDINPINIGHLLIVPNTHHEKFQNIEPEISGHMFKTAQKIIKSLDSSDIQNDAHNIFLSDGELAGQDVFHSHLHILPRFKDDGIRAGFNSSNTLKFNRDELDKLAESLKFNN